MNDRGYTSTPQYALMRPKRTIYYYYYYNSGSLRLCPVLTKHPDHESFIHAPAGRLLLGNWEMNV